MDITINIDECDIKDIIKKYLKEKGFNPPEDDTFIISINHDNTITLDWKNNS